MALVYYPHARLFPPQGISGHKRHHRRRRAKSAMMLNELCSIASLLQGISGHNRHRAGSGKGEETSVMAAVLRDPRNRQMSVFYNFVDHFKPRFVVMEVGFKGYTFKGYCV